jgi:predicted nucleotidyltransferase
MNKIEAQIKKILDEYLDKQKYAYFLFGSQVSWKARKNSDYDVWIYAKDKIPFKDYLKIKRLIEENVDYPVDVVDFTRVDEDFKNLALKQIKIWNQPKGLKIL